MTHKTVPSRGSSMPSERPVPSDWPPATAFAPLAALAGGQAEGTGLALGIEDVREGYALLGMGGFMFAVFFRWSAEQPDADSDFFGEYDERRL